MAVMRIYDEATSQWIILDANDADTLDGSHLSDIRSEINQAETNAKNDSIPLNQKGAINGVAGINANGKVVDANGNEVEGKVKSVNSIVPDENGNILIEATNIEAEKITNIEDLISRTPFLDYAAIESVKEGARTFLTNSINQYNAQYYLIAVGTDSFGSDSAIIITSESPITTTVSSSEIRNTSGFIGFFAQDSSFSISEEYNTTTNLINLVDSSAAPMTFKSEVENGFLVQDMNIKEYIDAEVTKLNSSVPSKTSELTNDSGFITIDSVTKAQVGLNSVQNYAVASQLEAEAGMSNSKYMTPLRTEQAITKLAPRPDLTGYATKNEVSQVDGKFALLSAVANTGSYTDLLNKPDVLVRDDIGITANKIVTYDNLGNIDTDYIYCYVLNSGLTTLLEYLKEYVDEYRTNAPVLKGQSFFNSTTGTIIPHTIGNTNYHVRITPTQNPNGYLGEVWVEYSATSFKVCCSGTATTSFSYDVVKI